MQQSNRPKTHAPERRLNDAPPLSNLHRDFKISEEQQTKIANIVERYVMRRAIDTVPSSHVRIELEFVNRGLRKLRIQGRLRQVPQSDFDKILAAERELSRCIDSALAQCPAAKPGRKMNSAAINLVVDVGNVLGIDLRATRATGRGIWPQRRWRASHGEAGFAAVVFDEACELSPDQLKRILNKLSTSPSPGFVWRKWQPVATSGARLQLPHLSHLLETIGQAFGLPARPYVAESNFVRLCGAHNRAWQ